MAVRMSCAVGEVMELALGQFRFGGAVLLLSQG